MTLPGFTAETSCARSTRTYASRLGHAQQAADGLGLAAGRLGRVRATAPGSALAFTCNGLECSCEGDADCNDLFSTGLCGDIASCDETGGRVRCRCLRL